MSKISPKKRKITLRIKRKKKKKLRLLRMLYKDASSQQEKKEIFARALKISPNLKIKDFIR